MTFQSRPSISRINRQQRATKALLIRVNSDGQNPLPVRYYELLYPGIALNDLELEAAVHIGSDSFAVSAFIRCCRDHLYALKDVRLSRLKRPYEVIAEYDSASDLVWVDPGLLQTAQYRSKADTISYLEYRRRRHDNKDRWICPYPVKAELWGIMDPREMNNLDPARLKPFPPSAQTSRAGNSTSQKPPARTFSEWHRLATEPKSRSRRRRKERMSEKQWLSDYFSAFISMGWICRNKGIGANRTRLTAHELIEHKELWFQKDRLAVFVYQQVEQVANLGIICGGWFNCEKTFDTVIRIVRGRRVDVNRGIRCLPDGTAARIIPDEDAKEVFRLMRIDPTLDPTIRERRKEKFYVDFDSKLFEPTFQGTWRPCFDELALEVYRAYREASPHFQSFRPYHRDIKEMAPHELLPGSQDASFNGFHQNVRGTASYPITKLL